MDGTILSFALLALGLTLLPGADTALVTRSTLRGGRTAGWYTTMGIVLGCSIHAVLSSMGLSAILARSAEAFQFVKIIGAVYLVWLGAKTLWQAWKDGRVGPTATASEHRPPVTIRSGFLEGLLTNLLNPKVAVFYLMVLPQFVRPNDPVFLRSLLLASIHIAFGLIWLSVYASLLEVLRSFLSRPKVRSAIETVTGIGLVLFGLQLARSRHE